MTKRFSTKIFVRITDCHFRKALLREAKNIYETEGFKLDR